jgi:hypothetical protein
MAAFLDLCRFVPTAGGTTDWTYSSTVGGCQSPSQAGAANGRKYKVYAVSSDLTQWEVSEGVYNSTTGTFPRTTVLYNSSATGTASGQSGAGTLINFSTVPNVAIVGIKEDLISIEEANSFTAAQLNQAQRNLALAAILRNYIASLQMSAAGSSATFTVGAGVAADSTNVDIMSLSAAISKTTGAWAAGSGNGALDTGTIAASSWYWVFLIKRLDTQVVDVLITKAVAASTPTPMLPSSYTIYRYIGSMKTDSSSNWLGFNQVDDTFYLKASIQDRNATISGLTDTAITLSVPLGIRVTPLFRLGVQLSGTPDVTGLRWRTPDLGPSDAVVNSTSEHAQVGMYTNGSSATRFVGAQDMQMTNTSAQLNFYINYGTGSFSGFQIDTYGWIDTRGKNV